MRSLAISLVLLGAALAQTGLGNSGHSEQDFVSILRGEFVVLARGVNWENALFVEIDGLPDNAEVAVAEGFRMGGYNGVALIVEGGTVYYSYSGSVHVRSWEEFQRYQGYLRDSHFTFGGLRLDSGLGLATYLREDNLTPPRPSPEPPTAVDFGLEQGIDEFTGERICSQRVGNTLFDDHFTGIGLALSEHFGVIIRVYRRLVQSDWTFLSSHPGDLVYFNFGVGEVISLPPSGVDVSFQYDYEVAALVANRELVELVLSAPQDIRIRFRGNRGNRDFTIRREVAQALAEGFGQACLPSDW